ncbi:hypothetical protein FOXG_03813 [Fusarium oxysporum f. sp. lycopersici 4287]|uniref:Uncharacterized protein n=2 Tax=Fusarium oxysporum TaxID=5507 RepID=A0A0J9ULB6_FUSO4|nr:hypothetical protein FOXG_03813 [Fusarium oxysporum f. sp. lycopersici 4287]KNB00189.1 hypothetical protein FOXG_03813 [Fusarium oxysporum f. sp. lycopersici 4287]
MPYLKQSRFFALQNNDGCRAVGPTYAFVLLVDPSAVGVRDHRIDNSESLLEAYRMMPRGRLSIIVAVPPNGSGFSMTTTEIPWSVLVPVSASPNCYCYTQ